MPLSRTAAACCGKAHPILRELQGRARAARRYRPLSSPAFPSPTIAPKNRPAIVGIAASQKDTGSFPSPATVAEAMEVLSRTRNPARRPNRTALGRLSLSKKPRCVSGGMRLPAANGGGGQAGLRQNAGKGATTTTAARAFRERTTHRWRQATWHIVVPFFFSFFFLLFCDASTSVVTSDVHQPPLPPSASTSASSYCVIVCLPHCAVWRRNGKERKARAGRVRCHATRSPKKCAVSSALATRLWL